MNLVQLKQFIENTFPICVNETDIDTNDNTLTWSIDTDGTHEDINELYDKLYSLEPFFNKNGYEILLQDESDYFGAQLKKVK